MLPPQFMPATRAWFEASFSAPTDAQSQGWESISSGDHTLIHAPTGSGKTWIAEQVIAARLAAGELARTPDTLDLSKPKYLQGVLPDGTVLVDGQPLDLSRYEYRLLEIMIGKPGWVFWSTAWCRCFCGPTIRALISRRR